jgi:hypothetical protein
MFSKNIPTSVEVHDQGLIISSMCDTIAELGLDAGLVSFTPENTLPRIGSYGCMRGEGNAYEDE